MGRLDPQGVFELEDFPKKISGPKHCQTICSAVKSRQHQMFFLCGCFDPESDLLAAVPEFLFIHFSGEDSGEQLAKPTAI